MFDGNYDTLPVPTSITGYTIVSSTGLLGDGKYYVLGGDSGFDYVILGTGAPRVPATPPELTSAFLVGIWPMAAETYDPALDGQGIPTGAILYGLFDLDYNTLAPPTLISGYTEVNSMTELSAGKYYVLEGTSGFSYVVLIG
jgi:hypothetical protein